VREASAGAGAAPGNLGRVGYEVRTDVFEGPFDLLLHLISAEEVDVYEISLARIVDAYLGELERMQDLDLDVATEFLLIAATLVELKCRRLLPGLDDLDLDEDLALFEERDLLLSRLVECKMFSSAARMLAALEAAASKSLARSAGPEERFDHVQPDLLAGVSAEMLRDAAARALAQKPLPRIDVDHILVDELTVAEVVDDLSAVLAGRGRVSFRALTDGLEQRIQVIVHFLALLELYKQGLIEIDQRETFGELFVWWCEDGDEGAGATAGAARPSESLVDADYRG
jgi:segregation and condensation protein A